MQNYPACKELNMGPYYLPCIQQFLEISAGNKIDMFKF